MNFFLQKFPTEGYVEIWNSLPIFSRWISSFQKRTSTSVTIFSTQKAKFWVTWHPRGNVFVEPISGLIDRSIANQTKDAIKFTASRLGR